MQAIYPNKAEAIKAKWFSRRHETNGAHVEHQENYKNGQAVKHQTAQNRQADRQKRTPQEQLAILDERLGLGVGAKKERERLEKAAAAK